MTRHPAALLARPLVGVGLALSLATPGVVAQVDPQPASPACHVALQALAQAEDGLAARAALSALPAGPAASAASSTAAAGDERQRAALARLLPLRQQVADACLGGVTGSRPSRGSGVAPVAASVVPGASPSALGRLLATPVPVVTVPLPRIEAPVTLMHCTGMSCLASDGSTLTRVGPGSVVGSRGACSLQGGLVRCP